MDLTNVSSKDLINEIVSRNLEIGRDCSCCMNRIVRSYKELIEGDYTPGWEVIEVGNKMDDGSLDVSAMVMARIPSSCQGDVELRRFYRLMKRLRKALGVGLG